MWRDEDDDASINAVTCAERRMIVSAHVQPLLSNKLLQGKIIFFHYVLGPFKSVVLLSRKLDLNISSHLFCTSTDPSPHAVHARCVYQN